MSNFNRSRLGLLILFGLIAWAMRFYSIVEMESSLLLDLHSRSNDSVDHLMLAINAIGGPKPVLALSLLCALLMFRSNKRVAITVPISVGISGAINVGLRALFHWPRPDLWHTLIYDHSFIWSFPGGHACLSASVATAINFALSKTRFKKLALVCGILYCLTVATTTLFLGVHYPLDILGGWISGFLIVSVIWSCSEAISARHRLRDNAQVMND